MALVCVTGGSGFLASWLIKLLLECGYTVRATVRDPGNLKKTAHLKNLPHARERLELVKADLLDDGCFDAAVEGCEGVFHVASPVKFRVDNPEELIIPAVKGTLNVLSACAKHKSVRRVVLTSSMGAVQFQALALSGSILVDESCWSDEDYCKANKLWYPLSKLLAEQKAWEFAKEKGLDLVVLIPGLIAGRPLQESLDVGTKAVLDILTGQDYPFKYLANVWVGVRQVAEAHLLALEAPTAFGRYICGERVMDCPAVLEVLQSIIANHALLRKDADEPLPRATVYKVSTEKLQELGLTRRPIEDALKETVEYLIEKGLLPQDLQIVS